MKQLIKLAVMIAMLLSVAGAFGQDEVRTLINGSVEKQKDFVIMTQLGDVKAVVFILNPTTGDAVMSIHSRVDGSVLSSTNFTVIDAIDIVDGSIFITKSAANVQVVIKDEVIQIDVVDK